MIICLAVCVSEQLKVEFSLFEEFDSFELWDKGCW